MSLIRQVWLLLLATLMLALAASVSVYVGSVRDTLQTQLRLKNSDNATALALVLSQQKGQRDLIEITAGAQFDTGFYRSVRFIGVDGQPVFQREAAAATLRAPAWFVAWVPIESAPGVAQVSDGWRALGSIEVVSQSAFAHDELWQGSLRAALALAVVGVLAGLFAALGVGRIRRPLDETIEQAASLQRGEYVTVAEPKVPELRRLTRAMNSMVSRLRAVFEAQAAQVESMRRQASCDALTGVANRAHFMAQLGVALQREDANAAAGLVLLRMLNLAELNRELGREHTDRLIMRTARALQACVDQGSGTFAGRLNGADFALVLPDGALALDTAQAMVDSLRDAFAGAASQAGHAGGVAAGVVASIHGNSLAGLMSAADLALARAEANGPFTVASADGASSAAARPGERVWREQLRSALLESRVRLGSFPVIDARQRLIHLECPLRVQLDARGPFEVAAHWLPLAIRSGLTCDVDERAVALALEAIERDGQPRCVNLSPASLPDSRFAARLRTLLQARPAAARALWMEVNESAAIDQFDRVRELARQVRPAGARLGLEHAGERLSRIERLFEAGLDYVKLDASVVQGVASDPNRALYVKGVGAMLRGLGLQVYAEGVADGDDAQALWGLGIDGQTGPWASAARADLTG